MPSLFIFYAISFGILFILIDLGLYFARKRFKFSDYTKLAGSTITKALRSLEQYLYPIKRLLRRFAIHQKKGLLDGSASQPIGGEDQNNEIMVGTGNQQNDIRVDISVNPSSNDLINKAQKKMVHFDVSADIPDGASVKVVLNAKDGIGTAEIQQTGNFASFSSIGRSIPGIFLIFLQSLQHRISDKVNSWNLNPTILDKYLLAASILVYALIIGIGIDRYPIYFFTDEAVHMNLAANFLRDGFENYFGEFLPTFFAVEGWVNGTSVYLQVLPFLIFGKSVIVTRLVSAFISLLGALSVGLLLRDIFKLKYSWVGIFALLTTPAWFLHARTAFEYVEVASFYSMFLYFYNRYRSGHLRSLYWAILAAGLAFYTHGLGQILVTISGIVLVVFDFRYHSHPDNRKTFLNGLLLVLILLLPFSRYYLAHPGEASSQVKRRGSYWVNESLTFAQKIKEFFNQYGYGLNPAYWFFKNDVDLERHTMKSYGNGLWLTIPFLGIGLFQTIKNIKIPSFRIIFMALLVCPIPAAVVAIGMPRMLWMAIPVSIITGIGVITFMQWLEYRTDIKPAWLALGVFFLSTGLAGYMLRDALANGPTWFQDYGLYGMQYGAKQVFQDVVRPGLEKDPNRRYVVSPSWANGTEQFVDFFIPDRFRSRVSLGQPIDFVKDIRKNPSNIYFVSTSAEYDKLVNNPEFKDIIVNQILPYPNKLPGFYVLTLKPADNIDEIISSEHIKNRTPIEDMLSFEGQLVKVIHSPLGSGRIEDIFDQDPDTLARVLEANPFVIDLYLPAPIDTRAATIQTGSLVKFTITVSLYETNSSDPVTYSQTFENQPPDPLLKISFNNGPAKSTRIFIAIKDETSGETSQIHIRTIEFN